MKTYALLNIPERCALVGGMVTINAPSLLGTTTTISVYTEYGTVWEKTVTAGKSYFIPMLIAPQGGMTLYLNIDTEIISSVRDATQAVTLPDYTPKILFSGRLMVPEEVHLGWRTVQVTPVEIEEEQK